MQSQLAHTAKTPVLHRPNTLFSLRPLTLAIHLACAGLIQLAPAMLPHANAQQQADNARTYAIPAGPLPAALNRFSQESGIFLAGDAQLTQGQTTPGLQGRHTVEQGLSILLRDSGLEAVKTANGTYHLRQQPATASSDVMLPTITATADAMPENTYVARNSSTATKTDTPITEIPQSISVVTREELDARAAISETEAMRYVPGLQAETYGNDDRGFSWFTIRGFEDLYSNHYVDGLRAPGASQTVPFTSTYGLESLEVLRGPSSVMFGQVDAGGIVNRVSKRPTPETHREIQAQVGNFDRRQIAADIGGAMTEDGRISYRLVAEGVDSDAQNKYPGFDRQTTKRRYVAPSFAWNPSPDTSFVLLSEFLDQEGAVNSFEYVGADLKRTGLLTGQPGFDKHDQRQWSVGYQLEHKFTPDWKVRQNLRTSEINVDANALFGLGFDSADPVTGDILQRANVYDEELRYTAVDTQLVGNIRKGDVEHTLVTGIDLMDIDTDLQRYRAIGPSVNINADPSGQYGRPVPVPTTLFRSSSTSQKQLGIYLQDQIKFGERWMVTLGGRWDRAELDTRNRLTDTRTESDNDAFSGRAGITYLLPNGLAPYASYTESFLPLSGEDFAGNSFEPTRGRQYEIGLKYQPPGTEQLYTAALFDLTKSNVATLDPDNPGFQRQTGEIRSRGLELESKLKLSRGLNLTAQYTYNDVEVTESNDVDLGQRPLNVPEQMASAWLDYTFKTGDLNGVGVGAGVRYVGKRYGDLSNSIEIPSYTLVDAAVHYDTGPWRFALNVNNLFDKDYVASYAYGYYRGVGRTAIATVRYRF